LILTVALACSCASARHHKHPVPHKPVAVVVAPPPAPAHITSAQQQRLDMVLGYLNKHKHITARQYGKMTGLSEAVADMELDSFARDLRSIKVVVKGKKKLYVRG